MKYINKSDMQGMIANKAKALRLASSIDTLAWVKHITGVDDTKKGGYSLIGNFVSDNRYNTNTLYIAKFERIESKQYTFNHYVLFLLTEDYEVRIKKVVLNVVKNEAENGKICNTKLNWATELTNDIKKMMGEN
jgi:hypothetical protein